MIAHKSIEVTCPNYCERITQQRVGPASVSRVTDRD